MTAAYVLISSRTNLANSAGDMSMPSLPSARSFSFTPGSASALRTSAEIFCTTPAGAPVAPPPAGVPAGAQTPNQSGESAPLTPASPVVGTSGSVGLRFAELTASARGLPLLMEDMPAEIGVQ